MEDTKPCILCGESIRAQGGLNTFYSARDGRTYAVCTGGCEGKGAKDDAYVQALIARKSDDERARSHVMIPGVDRPVVKRTPYLMAWLRGSGRSPRHGNVLFESFSDMLMLGPVRIAIAVMLPVLGALVGNWIGYPRVAVGLALGVALCWILAASRSLGFFGYSLGANLALFWLVAIFVIAFGGLSIYWTTLPRVPASILPLSDVALESFVVLVTLDLLGIAADVWSSSKI